MSNHQLEALPADIAELLALERAAPGPGPEVAARVLTRVEASVAVPPAAAAPASAGFGKLAVAGVVVAAGVLLLWPAADQPLPGVATQANVSEPPEAAGQAPAAAEGEPTERSAPLPALALPITGGQAQPVTPRVALAERRAPRAPVATTAASTATHTRRQAHTEAAHERLAPARPRAVKPKSVRASPPDIESERKLLLEARRQLQRGSARGALALFVKHAKRFPQGLLTEEREAGRIQALARMGRSKQATRRAARFERRFPGSIHLPAIRQALTR